MAKQRMKFRARRLRRVKHVRRVVRKAREIVEGKVGDMARVFLNLAHGYGLRPSYLNQQVKLDGKEYTIVGLKDNDKDNCVYAMCAISRKLRILSARLVRKMLGNGTLGIAFG